MSTLPRRLATKFALVAATALVAVMVPSPAAQAAGDNATFFGHGWGHGRGMGQYGAYGYAVNYGWTYDSILRHYYGGTTLANNAGNPTVTVELLRMAGRDTIVAGAGLAINNVPVGAAATLIQRTSVGVFKAFTAPGCAGPWTPWGGALGTGLTIKTSDLVRVCEPTKVSTYRGTLKVVDTGGTQNVLSVLSAQDYLRGVVPRESPASWGDAGGGRGMEALKAQAVAARSYALGSAPRVSGATTCDSTACQVYLGAYEQVTGKPIKQLEDARSDAAITATIGHVMRAANGSIARTEFSSSTGGWTAGGTFPTVQDLGDATANNSNHNWTKTMAFTDIAARLGTKAIRSMKVTARNGHGAEGGRATSVTVTTTDGLTTSFTGNEVRSKLGLASDWFSVSGISVSAAQQVVRSLYQDMLGRGVDPSGLQNGTNVVLSTGGARLFAGQLAASPERLNKLVSAQYLVALDRSPEPAGQAGWVALVKATGSVYRLQVGIYASPESLQVLGAGSVNTWVGALYLSVLGRAATPAERVYWTNVAVAKGRSAVVALIAGSPEAGMRRLTAYYGTFLMRSVDPSGRSAFLPMMNGRGDFDVPINLAASPEYLARAQTRTF